MDWKDKSLSAEERAQLLVSQMTLEEKISQMTFFSSALPRFAIPEYNWWNEALHGVARAGTATMFPQAIGMAACFDVPLMYKAASVIAKEARIKHTAAAVWEDRGIYKGLTMWSPNINIFRDPRWGRGHETYGEDPWLTGRLGVAFIKGLQGDDADHPICDATAKHFAVHSGPEASRHNDDMRPAPKDMALTYLPAFKAAVTEAYVNAVMGAYNRVNGEAACASVELLQKTLREQWGFKGYVVSDCGAIEDIYAKHKITKDAAEAAALAVKNGCDLCCGWAFPHLIEAVERGLICEETISQSVKRLMASRIRLGLLDEKNISISPEMYAECDSPAHHELSLKMAQESLVLIKNNGVLPLKSDSLKTLAVIGPNADSRLALIGNYAGTPSESWTVLEGLQKLLLDVRILYAEGCTIVGEPPASGEQGSDYRLAEALQAASIADTIIVVTGLNGQLESEESDGGGDRSTLDLPESQKELIDALHTVKGEKGMVLVNMTGSAVSFTHEEDFDAIVQAWYPGQMGGIAIAQMLLGMFAPNGRLPLTFYKSVDQLPPFADYSMKGRTYRYFSGECAFPFGYGLSYNAYTYSDLQVRRETNGLIVQVRVRNDGKMSGKETVQAYISWIQPDTEMPLRQLVAVEKVEIEPDEEKQVTMHIPLEALQVCDDEGRFCMHNRGWRIFVGGSQPDARSIELTGKKPLEIIIE